MREWTPPSWSKGIYMRMGSSVSLTERRLSSEGFPLMGGNVSRASLNRSVIMSDVMAD